MVTAVPPPAVRDVRERPVINQMVAVLFPSVCLATSKVCNVMKVSYSGASLSVYLLVDQAIYLCR